MPVEPIALVISPDEAVTADLVASVTSSDKAVTVEFTALVTSPDAGREWPGCVRQDQAGSGLRSASERSGSCSWL